MVYHSKADSVLEFQLADQQATQTIAAIATPPGKGGIGVIRVSGTLAKVVGEKLCGAKIKPLTPLYRKFIDGSGEVVDEGIILYFQKPNSYTGEDVCEFQCHGSPMVLNMLMEQITNCGARIAEPGEFTRRAFLNRKLDLAQAEAVVDLINSSTQAAARSALRSLTGEFSKRIDHISEQLLRLRVYVEAAIDFAEEEIDFLQDDELDNSIERVQSELVELSIAAEKGILLREGVRVTIAGLPNAGKSSLLNLFAGDDKAIVTPQPGTTRDMIDIAININNIATHITDTAGLRASEDPIELEGIRRAWNATKDADLVLYIVDDEQGVCAEDEDNLRALSQVPVILVWNKIDITGHKEPYESYSKYTQVFVSAKKKTGLNELCKQIEGAFNADFASEGVFLARRRHLDSIQAALEYVNNAQQLLGSSKAGELVADDLRVAHQELGKVVGQVSSEDLLGKIFSSFCIGK